MEIADIEEEGGSKMVADIGKEEDPMATPFMLNQKVMTLSEIARSLNNFTLQPEVVII